MTGVVPPVDEILVAVPLTDVTGAVPLLAAVNLPCASTVILEFVYEPADTAVLGNVMVIALAPLVTVMPVPAVNVAAAGAPAVEPIIN